MKTIKQKETDQRLGVCSTALLAIGERLRTQDNRCTAYPMFCVQEKMRDTGYSSDFADTVIWISEDDYSEVPEGTPGSFASGYKERWETVMVAFTNEGAAEYLQLNGHNHRGETRIYVESFNRCPEMIAVRGFLMANAKLIHTPEPQ